MTRLLLAFLVYSLCCYSSNAQLLEEGSTTTTEIETQGGVEEVTETTVTIEHKTTGDILDGDTGVVTSKYEGDADIDWGGAGSVYSHSSCTDAASGFPATGTDGRTSACGHARTNSLTTWRQYVDLNSFGIEDGGEVNYEFLFAFPNSMYQNSGQTAYVQTKGYNDNVLQWETGLVTIDKTTFTQNPYDYNNNTNWVNTVTGSYDFANQLDKVYIEIGGYGEYYWDEFQYNVVYNHITTVVETWMQVAQQEQDVTTTIDLMDNYDVTDYDQDVGNTNVTDVTTIDLDIPDPEPVVDAPTDMPDVVIDMPGTTETTNVGEMFQDLTIDMPLMDVEEVAEVQEIVAEIQEIETMDVSPPQNTESSSNTVSEPVSEPVEEISEPSEPATEVVENTSIEEPTNETESSQESSEAQETEVDNKVEEKTEVAENETENTETQVENEEKPETEEEKASNEEAEEKEVAQKEEPKEEPKEEEAKEDVQEETEVAEKPSKQEESKQEKAKEILSKFDSQYDAVAQIATLALVNALGPNIKTYETTQIQTLPVWYEPEDIYTDANIPDPLGNYIGVRDSLVFESMVGEQYE